MGGVARHGTAGSHFWIALIGSALFFALLHLGRPFPGDPTWRITIVRRS